MGNVTLLTLPTPTHPSAGILLLRLLQYAHETYELQEKKDVCSGIFKDESTQALCSSCSAIVKVEMTSPEQRANKRTDPVIECIFWILSVV